MQRKVLIVEDNQITRDILESMLNQEYEVLKAGDGLEALEILGQRYDEISAVVLDLLMPRMNGYEFLEKMRSNPLMKQIPVIVATGTDEPEAEENVLEAGANDYVTKPYNPGILKHRLYNTIELREQAAIVNAIRVDALTGLYSRSAFFEKTEEMTASHGKGFYVMECFDIEKFRMINDQYGNVKGDEVLVRIANVLKSVFEPIGGICCRIMADNFAVLYPKQYVNSKETEKMCEYSLHIEGMVQMVYFCVGRYVVDDNCMSPSAMYDRASIAKESVKGLYDERVGIYDESMRQKQIEEQKIISEMSRALRTHQFEVWYQPQFNHLSGALIGAETLVRWNHPHKGLISPAIFVPIFEKNGFIYELDKFVWNEVCLLLKEFQDQGMNPLPVSVNISVYDLFRDDLDTVLTDLIKKYQIPIELLHLEIAEPELKEYKAQGVRVVEKLKNLGFIVIIDDLGSGTFSLNTLQDTCALGLKLNMNFLNQDEKCNVKCERFGNVVESVIRMAKWLGMFVIAKGVETIEQADFLKSVGCYYIQGNLYSAPVQKWKLKNMILQNTCGEKIETLEKVETYDNEAFWDPQSMDTLIFNSYVGGASVFEYTDGKVEILRANDKYIKVLIGNTISGIDPMKIEWGNYMDEENRKKSRQAMLDAIQTKSEVTDEMELRGLRENGKSAHIRAIMRVIAKAGNRYLFYCMLEDMTAQREAEKLEKQLSEQMQMILDYAGSGISAVVENKDGVEVLFANDQYYAMLGYTKKQYEKEVKSMFSLICPEDTERVFKALQKLQHPVLVDYRVVRRNGCIRWIRLLATRVIRKLDCKPVRINVYRDCTEEKESERIIQESVKELSNLNIAMNNMVNDIPGGFVQMHINDEGKYVADYLNRGFCEMIGMSEEEIMFYARDNVMWNVHAEDAENLLKQANRMVEEKGTLRIKYRLRHKNGQYIPILAFGRTTVTQSGETCINVYYTDITEEMKEEERRRELLENLPCGAGIYEYSKSQLKGVYLNRIYWDMVGREPYDLSTRQALDFVQLEDKAYLLRILQAGILGNGKIEGEFHILHGNGKYVPFQINGNVIKQEGRKYTLYVTYLPIAENAVTFRKMLPVALKAMMASSTDYSFIKDRTLHYVCASHAFAVMAGFSNENEIIGKTDYDIFDKEFADKFRNDDQQVMQNGRSLVDSIEKLPSKDGVARYSNTSKYLLKDSAGNTMGLYGVGRDITESREAYERLKLITDSIPGGVGRYEISSKHIRTLYLSDGVNAITGYQKGEYAFEDSNPMQFIIPEDQPKMQEQINALLGKGTPIDCDFRLKQKSGECRWVKLRGSESERQENIATVNTVMFDITEQKKAELKLNELERDNWNRYEHELQLRKELVKDAVFYYQLNLTSGIVEEYYSKYNDIPDMKKNGVFNDKIRRSMLDKIRPEDHELIRSSVFSDGLRAAYAEGKTSYQAVYRRMLGTPEYRWVKIEISIMEKPDNGDVVAFLHCRDIDTEYRAQQAIETILDEDIELVVYVMIRNGAAYVAHTIKNGFYELHTFFDFEQKCQFYCEHMVIEEDKEIYRQFFTIEHLINELKKESGAGASYQVREGQHICRKTVKAYYLDDGKDVIVLTRRDTTQVYMEEQIQKQKLQAAVEAANFANRAKSDFLSHMSHDIRTPLNAVLAFSNAEMLDGADEAQLKEYLNKVNISGEYLLGIINDVLDMSKIEQQKIVLNPEPYARDDFESTIRNVVEELCKKKKVHFVVDTSRDITQAILVDHVRFNQIFINLLSNAVKFTPENGTVELIMEEHKYPDHDESFKRMIVRDNGIGMSEEFLPHAFESFNQEYRKETSEKTQGTGLGLSIVKNLVALMGGTIKLESHLNQGTTFTIDIPFEPALVESRKEKEKPADYQKMQGEHILLAEDNQINTFIAVSLLRKRGCIVDCAENGEIACRKFKESELGYYQLILMDIRMPVMDGLTAVKKIRGMRRKDSKTIPIVAMTADAFNEDKKNAYQAGINDYITKPIDPARLYEVCSRYGNEVPR